jgi:hypothetical protein
MAKEKRHAWNDTHRYSDTAADRRAAELGLFKRMGLLSGRWARHHSDHRYYFGPDGTNLAPANQGRGSGGASNFAILAPQLGRPVNQCAAGKWQAKPRHDETYQTEIATK